MMGRKKGGFAKRVFAFFLVLILLSLWGCGGPARQDLYAMDTIMNLQIWGADKEEAVQTLSQYINTLEAQLSVTQADSVVAQLNSRGCAEVPEEIAGLLSQSTALSQRTEGALDITIYPLVRLWGFTSGEYHVPNPAEIQVAAALCGGDKLELAGNFVTLSPGTMVDLGAVAKGYAGREAAALLDTMDIDCAVLSLGGNIQTYGTKPDGSDWQIAVRDPFDDSNTLGTLSLSGTTAAVTSGGYQRYFTENGKTYCHIIDPATGSPAESGLASVTIVAEDGLLADGLSTALYVMGLEKAVEFWQESQDFEAVFVTDAEEIFITSGLAGRFSNGKAQVITP